jgi:hypothetical protein
MSRLAGALVLAAALFGLASVARAHIVVGSKSLRVLVAESDLVLRARVVEVRGIAGRSLAGPGLERPDLEAVVLEILKGELPGGAPKEGSLEPARVRFVQHGHGVATFEPGREYLLFLVDLARIRELGVLAETGAHRWVSLQEHDAAHPLDAARDASGRDVRLAATRAYVGAEIDAQVAAATGSGTEARWQALRGVTLALLGSGDAGLAASVLGDLVAAPDAPFVTPADRPALEAILDDPRTTQGVRVALLAELERRGLLAGGSPSGEERWLALLQDAGPSADLVVAIRAAGQDARPAVRARLLALLSSERDDVAAAAASSLGRSGDASTVVALAASLEHPSSRVRQAAIRGLGRTRTAAALQVLEEVGASHPDPATRRLAAAEARKRHVQAAAPPSGSGASARSDEGTTR